MNQKLISLQFSATFCYIKIILEKVWSVLGAVP